MNAGKAALIWCPFGKTDDARLIAGRLLDEKLIACANILPQVTSMFVWQGTVQTEDEVVAVMKTTAEQLEHAVYRLAELHPYDTPAITGWLADAAPDVTCQWLENAMENGAKG